MSNTKFHPDANRRTYWCVTYRQHKEFLSLYEATTHKTQTSFFKELFEFALQNYKEDLK